MSLSIDESQSTRRRTAAPPPPSSAPPSQRLVSLDALRGFDMFWITGGRELVIALAAWLNPAWVEAVETQVTHPRWKGFVVWDLIMPLFLFLVGASMPFAFSKRVERGEKLSTTYSRIFRRFVLLWFFGLIAQGLLRFQVEGLELFSNTLQAIAVGYVVTSVALLHLPLRGQWLLFAGLTIGYWALLTFVPFGHYPAGTIERTANFARYVDELILGRFRRDHDYTWIVTSLGFSATVLLGAQAGHLLRARISAGRRLVVLVLLGLAGVASGWIWSYWLPLNRHIWTSSMILYAGGWSFLILALFYGVIDVAGIKRWSFFFVVIGANALLAYMFSHVYERTMSDALVGDLAKQLAEPYDELLRCFAEIGLLWMLLWYLYRHRTFLRA